MFPRFTRPISVTFLLFSVEYFFSKYFRGYNPKLGRQLALFNNLFYGIVSALLFVFAFLSYHMNADSDASNNTFCTIFTLVPESGFPSLYLFSKIWEFQDLLWVHLSGGPVSTHFKFHHLTTYLIAWIGVEYNQSWLFPSTLINLLLHAVMYPFFAGFTLFRPLFPILGAAQLLLGIGASLISIQQQCLSTIYPDAILCFFLLFYLILFIQENSSSSSSSHKEKNSTKVD